MKIAIAQINPVVGDVIGNTDLLRRAWEEAFRSGADFIISPELSLTGYPLDDLTLRASFLDDVRQAVSTLAVLTKEGPSFLIGAPWQEEGRLYNAALLLADGQITAKLFKQDLPNYGPFDDKRVFSSGPLSEPIVIGDHKIGLMICEDMWTPNAAKRLAEQGADYFVVINGSPYETDKLRERQSIARSRVLENGIPLIYTNLVGGQDELVFDGASFVMNNHGEVCGQAYSFTEDMLCMDWGYDFGSFGPIPTRVEFAPEAYASQYRAIVRGLQDYVGKNGFSDVILGLSGGIDSALVAVLAVEALGADHVHTVMMPSIYTTRESVDDAIAVAKAIGCSFTILPITQAVDAFDESLVQVFGNAPHDFTQENIQSRSRGLMLMAMSNRSGALLLATGNKSEMAVGYATLYGDMCGAYAPIKDLYKTDVYNLARYAVSINGTIIPEQIFTKPPTAELRPDQKDQDSLPPYDVLDDILRGLVERDMSFSSLVEQGYDLALVKSIWKMLQKAEFKRRQAPPGPKISRRHLSKDRRYPITNGYMGS